MSRRTTWEGVESSSAQRRSNTAFLRGSIRIVRRAVRSSIAKEILSWGTGVNYIIILYTFERHTGTHAQIKRTAVAGIRESMGMPARQGARDAIGGRRQPR